MHPGLQTYPTGDPASVQRWEVKSDDGDWQLLQSDFDPTGLEEIGDGLWMFPLEPPKQNNHVARSVFGTVFRVSTGLLLENPESKRRSQRNEGWGERVMDDGVPGTEIYIDDKGRHVFRHIGANHVLLNNTAKYADGSVGKETTLTHPDGRVFHASGRTLYPDGRSLNRRTGVLTDLGGNDKQLERGSGGEWEVPAIL